MPQLKFIKENNSTIYPITIPEGIITDVTNKKNLSDSLDEKVDKNEGIATNLTVENDSDNTALTIKASGYYGIKIVPRQPYNNLSPRARIMYEGKDSYIDIPTLQSGSDTLALQSSIPATDSTLSTSSSNPIANSTVKNALDNKVDKEDGKGLSTNDYTTTEKTKLSGIEEGATKTTVDSSLNSTSTNPVQNKVIQTALGKKVDASGGVATNLTVSDTLDIEGKLTINGDIQLGDDFGGGTEYSIMLNTVDGLYTIGYNVDSGIMQITWGNSAILFPNISNLGTVTLATTDDIPTTDTSLSSSSSNPIANSAVQSALSGKVDSSSGIASNLTVAGTSDNATALTANGDVEFGVNSSTGNGSQLKLKTGQNSACSIVLESDTDDKDPIISFSYGSDYPTRGLSIKGYDADYTSGCITFSAGGILAFPSISSGNKTIATTADIPTSTINANTSAISTLQTTVASQSTTFQLGSSESAISAQYSVLKTYLMNYAHPITFTNMRSEMKVTGVYAYASGDVSVDNCFVVYIESTTDQGGTTTYTINYGYYNQESAPTFTLFDSSGTLISISSSLGDTEASKFIGALLRP